VTAPAGRLSRALGIERGEHRIFAWAASTAFLVGTANVSLSNVGDTLFLKRIGVDWLPWAFLASSLLLAATTFAMSFVTARREPLGLVRTTFLGLALALVPLWLLVVADVKAAFFLLMLASKQVISIAAVVFWLALGTLLQPRQAKRLFAPVAAGATVGELVGSFASAPIGRVAGLASLLLIAIAAMTLAGLLATRLPALAPRRLAPREPARSGAAPDLLSALRPLWRESRLFRHLAWSALLGGLLAPMLFFQFSYVANLATQGSDAEQKLLRLFALFRGYLNVAVLVLQLVGTSRLFQRVGVPLSAMLSPLVFLLGFLGVSVSLRPPAAMGALTAASVQDRALYEPAQRILLTLLPDRLRPAGGPLIEGPVRRLGGAIGNLLMIAVLAAAGPAWVGIAGLPVAALWLVLSGVLWRLYPSLLLDAVREQRVRDEEIPLADLLDRGTLRTLEAWLADPDPEKVRAALSLVAEAAGQRGIEPIARALRRASGDTRPLLLDALRRLLDRDPKRSERPAAAAALLEILAAPEGLDPGARARVVHACAQVGPRGAAAQALAAALEGPAPCVRLAAAAAVAGAGALPPGEIERALASDDPALRDAALDALRDALLSDATPLAAASTPAESWVALVASRLADAADRARSAEILADLAGAHATLVGPHTDALLACADDPDARVRAAVLRFAGRARLGGQARLAVARLAAADDDERSAAREAVRQLGDAAAEALLEALHFERRATRSAAAAELRELPLDARMLERLAARELANAERTLRWAQGLARRLDPALVHQRLRERADESLHTALLLLSNLLGEERIAWIADLLLRSESGRARSVLMEALEALLPQTWRERLLPLLEAARARERAAAWPSRLPPLAFEEAQAEARAEGDPLTLRCLAADLARAPHVAPALRIGEDAVPRSDEGAMASRIETVLHLRALDLFARLTTRQLDALAERVVEETRAPGEAIVREGEFGDCMYVIVGGHVRVSRGGRLLSRLGPGDFFGEMSLFDGETRSATASAEAEVRLLRLDRQSLFREMEDQPAIAIAVCQRLSRRLREANERLPGSGEGEAGPG
jgi:hypothetical protein